MKEKSFKYCVKQMVEEREKREKVFYIKIMLRGEVEYITHEELMNELDF